MRTWERALHKRRKRQYTTASSWEIDRSIDRVPAVEDRRRCDGRAPRWCPNCWKTEKEIHHVVGHSGKSGPRIRWHYTTTILRLVHDSRPTFTPVRSHYQPAPLVGQRRGRLCGRVVDSRRSYVCSWRSTSLLERIRTMLGLRTRHAPPQRQSSEYK